MTQILSRKIDEFCQWAQFETWNIEDGELIMYDKGEPFGYTEYKRGSPIWARWKALQEEVSKES